MFEVLHFRGSDKILKKKNMLRSTFKPPCNTSMTCSQGCFTNGSCSGWRLDEMDWARDTESMRIIDGRRYMYKGVKRKIAIDGNISAYEYILEGLVRLQLGYDKERIDAGILLVNSRRSDKSPYGTTADLIRTEIELLSPTIHLPVTVLSFQHRRPGLI